MSKTCQKWNISIYKFSITFFLFSFSFIFKEKGRFRSPEQSSTLLKWQVRWDTCILSRLFTGMLLFKCQSSQICKAKIQSCEKESSSDSVKSCEKLILLLLANRPCRETMRRKTPKSYVSDISWLKCYGGVIKKLCINECLQSSLNWSNAVKKMQCERLITSS